MTTPDHPALPATAPSDLPSEALQRVPRRPITNKDWDCYDVCNKQHPRPPRGVMLYCVNPGGVGHLSMWYPGVRYWAFYPGIPDDPHPDDLLPMPI